MTHPFKTLPTYNTFEHLLSNFLQRQFLATQIFIGHNVPPILIEFDLDAFICPPR